MRATVWCTTDLISNFWLTQILPLNINVSTQVSVACWTRIRLRYCQLAVHLLQTCPIHLSISCCALRVHCGTCPGLMRPYLSSGSCRRASILLEGRACVDIQVRLHKPLFYLQTQHMMFFITSFPLLSVCLISFKIVELCSFSSLMSLQLSVRSVFLWLALSSGFTSVRVEMLSGPESLRVAHLGASLEGSHLFMVSTHFCPPPAVPCAVQKTEPILFS